MYRSEPRLYPRWSAACCGSTRGDSGIWREARSHDSKFGLPCCGPESCSQRGYLGIRFDGPLDPSSRDCGVCTWGCEKHDGLQERLHERQMALV
jgi:hypothetical protein